MTALSQDADGCAWPGDFADARNRGLDASGGLSQRTLYDSQVKFGKMTPCKSGAVAALGLPVFGQQEDAGGVFVDPMHKPQGFGRVYLSGQMFKEVGCARSVGRHGNAGRLIEQKDLPVFIKDRDIGFSHCRILRSLWINARGFEI